MQTEASQRAAGGFSELGGHLGVTPSSKSSKYLYLQSKFLGGHRAWGWGDSIPVAVVTGPGRPVGGL